MSDLSVRRLAGGFGLAIVALNWAMFPLYMVTGPAPQFQDTARFINYWISINGLVLNACLARSVRVRLLVGLCSWLAPPDPPGASRV